MAHNKPLVPPMEVDVSPGGSIRRRGDDKVVLLETTPGGRKRRQVCKLATTRSPRARRGQSSFPNSGSEDESDDTDDGDSDDTEHADYGDVEDFVDFRALKESSRRLRGFLIDEEEAAEEVAAEGAVEVGSENILESENILDIKNIRDCDIILDCEIIELKSEAVDQGLELPVVDQMTDLDKFSWSEDFTTFSGQEETYRRTPGPLYASRDPVEAFISIWDDSIVNSIVEETNRYAWQTIAPLTELEGGIPKSLNWNDTTSDELYRYFALLIIMSICYRSDQRDYWSTGFIEMPQFRKVMPRNRFFELSRFLHFVDNDTVPIYGSRYEKKISKIRPIIDHCNKKFSTLYTPNKHLSLDESLLLWKGRLSWVQCIRSKAARFGIKSYELCEAETGYVLRSLLYAGKDSSMHPSPISGFKTCAAKVVLELMDGYLDVGHTLAMDNWYNQLSLTRFLKRRCTDVIGTMNPSRLHVPNDIKSARLSRWEQITRHCGDISLVAWQDVKLVTAISTYHSDNRVPSRRSGQNFEKPEVIATYNKFMGGVDSKDQQLSMFLMERKKGRKWYIKVFKRFMNISILNAFIIYRKNPLVKIRTHREFRYQLALGLLERFAVPAIEPTLPCGEPSGEDKNVRRLKDGLPKHRVGYTEKIPGKTTHRPKRCVRCTAAGRRTNVTLMCIYCQVPLCLGTCFDEYHTLVNLK